MPRSALAGAIPSLRASINCAEIFSSDLVKLLKEVSRVSEIIVFRVGILDNMRVLCWHTGIDLDVTLAKVLDSNGIEG